MRLYPRLMMSTASEIAKQKSSSPPSNLRQLHSGSNYLLDTTAMFAPTGGYRVDVEHLRNLRQRIRECADALNFPKPPDIQIRQIFDLECSIILFQYMGISPSEASNLGVWTHMTCILLPDIVRWRFYNEKTSEDRFIGSARGLRCNTFGRLWWRAYLLYDSSKPDDPFFLLNHFGEDDLVQITERPSIAGNPVLAKQILYSFLSINATLKASEGKHTITSRELLRDVIKRVRRLLPFIVFDALDQKAIKSIIDDLFTKSAQLLRRLD